jgi:recombination protein RecT
MPRISTLMHPLREIAPLREAATLLLVRDGSAGMQVLMTRRSLAASFAPGVYVFPGGGIDSLDHKVAEGGEPRCAVHWRAGQTSMRVAALAAMRESFEELGILLAKDEQGQWCTTQQIAKLNRQGDFYVQMQAQRYRLQAAELHLFAHWITDRDMPRRFDVPFFVARMPEDQEPVADETEQFAPEWVSAADALARHAQGQFPMIFPTVRTLQRLKSFCTVEHLLAACSAEKPLWTSCPRAGLMHGQEHRLMEHESAYGELALVAPFAQIAHELSWQHDKPVQLLKHVARLTAPNPSVMTGPGTNTYIVGTSETGYIVIDPGPAIDAHIDRIMRYTDGEIVAIVCTHSHPDHSPGAWPLQAKVVEASQSIPSALMDEFAHHMCPVLGMPSGEHARDTAQFDPDLSVRDGELLGSYFRRQDVRGAFKIELQVIHTPGHASNHVCLALPEDGLLFTGDHILNGSTTVVDPPDGGMTAYLDSLDKLSALCMRVDIRFILPAHGYVLSACDNSGAGDIPMQDSAGGATRAIAQLKAHRLKREAKVIAAMRSQPSGSTEDWVTLAYDDVDPKIWPVAARSLLAHVQRIRELALI